MKFSCMMELNKYPLDVQVCTMEVASCEFNFISETCTYVEGLKFRSLFFTDVGVNS